MYSNHQGSSCLSFAFNVEIQHMVKTASTMLPIGTKAPDFQLVNIDGRTMALADFRGKPALLVMFICNHCPFVKHLAADLAQFANDYQARGVAIVAINSNDT